MISAWKRLINKGPDNHQANSGQPPPGVHRLDRELQRKFGRGVNYNMKIVIKGDNRVGKTSLFLRLKGCPFDDNYNPTETLNVTSIDWNYKATDDVVKIDLWEAIDSTSRKSVNFVDLKMETANNTNHDNQQQHSNGTNDNNNHMSTTQHTRPIITTTNVNLYPNGCNGNSKNHSNNNNNNNHNYGPIPESAKQSLAELSANFDVYEGANAVLLLLDMTKLWTFKYVQQEIVKIPKDIPVLVIANHRDQGHHRTVSGEQVKAFLDGLVDRVPEKDAIVMYTEASMRNGFGLKFIEKFFNVPFLKLQEKSLRKQLELNEHEYSTTKDELSALQETTNLEYEQYLELETIKRRQQADAMSPINSGLKQLDEATREQIRNATVSCDTIDKNNSSVKSIESNPNTNQTINAASQNFVNDRLPSIVIGAKCPLPENKAIQISNVNGTGVRSHTNNNIVSQNQEQQQSQQQHQERKTDTEKAAADDYESDESDDEEEPRANPLVANYQSDIDSDD